jgi:hypothetical protein
MYLCEWVYFFKMIWGDFCAELGRMAICFPPLKKGACIKVVMGVDYG